MNIATPSYSLPLSTHHVEPKKVVSESSKQELQADSAKEEIAIAVGSKMADEKKASSKNASSSAPALHKRVELIEQINELLNTLNAKEKDITLSRQLKQVAHSETHLSDFVSGALGKGEEPGIIFLSLKKLQKEEALTEQQKKAVSSVTDQLVNDEEYATSIKASFNVAEVTSEYFSDNTLASQFRVLLGKGNHEKLNTAQILSTLMEVGKEENFDVFLKAYTHSLAKDFNAPLPMPSTQIDYLVDKFSRLTEVSATASLLDLAEKTLGKLNDKYSTMIDSPARLGASVLDYTQCSNQDKISRMATEFMTIGQDKKAFFANKVLDMVSKLPVQIWEGDVAARHQSIDELIKYSSILSQGFTTQQSGLNKAFLS